MTKITCFEDIDRRINENNSNMNRLEDICGYENLNQHDLETAKRYLDVLNKAADPNSELYVNAEFTSHGIAMCCNSDDTIGGILISGINPGYNDKLPNGVFYSFDKTMQSEELYRQSSYWRNKEKQLYNKDYSLLKKTAYIDLFPYAQSKQKQFMKDIKGNCKFQVDTLEITIEEIERLRPKLIIAANTSTSYYWGISDATWLGYNLQKVKRDEMPHRIRNTKLRLYRIVGDTGYKIIEDKDYRIGQNKYTKTNLLGAYFINYGQYDERHEIKSPGYLLTPQIVRDLYNWIEQNS